MESQNRANRSCSNSDNEPQVQFHMSEEEESSQQGVMIPSDVELVSMAQPPLAHSEVAADRAASDDASAQSNAQLQSLPETHPAHLRVSSLPSMRHSAPSSPQASHPTSPRQARTPRQLRSPFLRKTSLQANNNKMQEETVLRPQSADASGSSQAVEERASNPISSSLTVAPFDPAQANSYTWPRPANLSPIDESRVSHLPHSSLRNTAVKAPRPLGEADAAGSLPLPIANLSQSTVQVKWRLASQTIALKLQEEERTHRAIHNALHSSTATHPRKSDPSLLNVFQAPTADTSFTASHADHDDVQRVLRFEEVSPEGVIVEEAAAAEKHHPALPPATVESAEPIRRGVPLAKREALDADWHTMSLEEICAQLDCDAERGLIEEEMDARRVRFGTNVLSTTGNKYLKLLILFAQQLVSGFGGIMWAAALLAFLAWKPFGDPPDPTNLGLAVVLLIVIFLQASFNFYQEYSSNQLMDSFRNIIPSNATVIRRTKMSSGSPASAGHGLSDEGASAGAWTSVEKVIESSELLVGDLVKLSMGQKIPADIRLVEVAGLKVNNSALTGEMEPVACTALCTSHNFLESANCVFFGSLAVEGSAIGVVVATGDATVLGKISQLTSQDESEPLTLHIEIGRFVKLIVVMAVITAAISLIGWGAWLKPDYPEFMPLSAILVNVIGLVVAYVPTGLPISVTLTLTMIAQRMFRQQVLVKNLATIETFNSVTSLLTDKTGTLTVNLMSVANIHWGLNATLTSSTASRGIGIHGKDSRDAKEFIAYRFLIQGAQLCNAAALRCTANENEDSNGAAAAAASKIAAVAKSLKQSSQASPDAELNAAVQANIREMRELASQTDPAPGHQALLAQLARSPAATALAYAAEAAAFPARATSDIEPDEETAMNPGVGGTNSNVSYSIAGDAADTAFYSFCTTHLGLNVEMTRLMYDKVQTLPFNSKNKFMISVHENWDRVVMMDQQLKQDSAEPIVSGTMSPSSPFTNTVESLAPSSLPSPPSSVYRPLCSSTASPHIVWMKGACEILIERCTTYLSDSGVEMPLTPSVREKLLDRMEALGRQGERVLGFARKELDFDAWADEVRQEEEQKMDALAGSENADKNAEDNSDVARFPSRDLCFVGMISLIDPPRPNVASSIVKCRKAGISVAMVTGDHMTTAQAIARQVNIISKPKHAATHSSTQQLSSSPLIAPHFAHSTTEAQDSLHIEEVADGSVKVKLMREGRVVATYTPQLEDEQDQAKEDTMTGDGQPSSAAPQSVVPKELEADDLERRRAAKKKSRAAVRPTLKDSLMTPTPPSAETSRLLPPRNASETIAEANGVHLVPINPVDDELDVEKGAGWSDADSFDSIAPLPYSLVLTGSQLKILDAFLWDWILRHTEGIVFARTSPEQKLRIVMEYQSRGHIVSVTGDGVNDAPALKKANLGVAMQSGAEVAREACDLILLDNNFSSVVTAIEMGRTVFDNLKKVTLYLLPAGSWSEMLPVISNVFLGTPLPLSPFLMIVICVLTDLPPSLALVNEKPEENIMRRRPRDVNKDHLVDGKLISYAYFNIGLIESFSGFLLFFHYLNSKGIPPSKAFLAFDKWQDGYLGFTQDELNDFTYTGQCIFFISLVITQFGNLLSVRTRRMSLFQQNPFWGEHRNLGILASIAVSTIISVLVTQIRVFNDLFNTRPVDFVDIAPSLGFAGLIFAYDELRKYIVRTRPDSIIARMSW